MYHLSLHPDEIVEIEKLLDRIVSLGSTVDKDDFLLEAQILSHELPKRVRQVFYQFKLTESNPGIIVKNSPIDLDRVGPTPKLPLYQVSSLTREEVLHVLYASLLGEVIAWSFFQDGNIINEIVPIREHEDKLISSGSKVLFDLHTDHPAHPYTGDYVGWFCIRNTDRVPTVVAALKDIKLEKDIKRILFEPRFIVAQHQATKPQKRVPIFFGDLDAPYIRLNLNIKDNLEDDKEACHALEVLVEALTAKSLDVVLEHGDFFYLDNYRAVHGRRPYNPSYDGNDRWLKRLCITSCFRGSRDLRDQPQSRVIGRY